MCGKRPPGRHLGGLSVTLLGLTVGLGNGETEECLLELVYEATGNTLPIFMYRHLAVWRNQNFLEMKNTS